MIEGSLTLTTYLRRFFQDVNNKNFEIANSLKITLDKYLEITAEHIHLNPSDELIAEIKAYRDYLDTSKVGSIVTGFTFNQILPVEIKELLALAHLLAQNQSVKTSPLVTECENIIAAANHSAESLFNQAARLEKALSDDSVLSHHEEEVRGQLNQWLALLYKRIGLLILESKDSDSLKSTFKKAFDEKLCLEEAIVSRWRKSIAVAIDTLESSKFFESFYILTTLPQKYDFVFDFVKASQKIEALNTPAIKAVLSSLYERIPDKAFEPFDRKLHFLSELTLETAFERLKHWSEFAWQKYQGSELRVELECRLDEKTKELQEWQNASDYLFKMDSPPQKPRPLALFEIHSMKYCYSGQDPKTLYPSTKQAYGIRFETEETLGDETASLTSLFM